MNLPMTIEEIKRKIKDEVPVQTIADLNGLDLKTFEKIIRQYEEKHGDQILPKRKPGRPKTSTPARSTKYARVKAEKEKPKDATVPKRAIEATLLAARKKHAEEVEKLHEAEASYKAAQDSEMGLRAIVLGLEMLLQKGGASE